MPKIPAPKFWIETLPSGRFRARFRDADGRKISEVFDYRYEAEAWGEAVVNRAALAVARALGEPVEPAPTPDLTVILEALRTAAFKAADLSEPIAADPAVGPTVAEYAPRFLNARRGHITAGTLDEYEGHLRRGVLASGLADVPLDQVGREAVDEWISDLLDDEVGRPSINKRLKVFRVMLNYAVANRVITHDPTAQIRYLATDLREFRVLGREDEARLLAECETPEARAQVLLALDAGLRWGEVAGLPVSAISGDYLTVRQVVERKTRKVRKFPKGKRARVVPMTKRLREALEVVGLMAELRGPDALMFVALRGGVEAPIDPHNWRRDFWTGATHRAKLNRRDAEGKADRLHFHDLRHTYGSRLAEAGVPRNEIRELMGHADESTTAIYIHEGTDGHRRDLVLDALEPALEPAPEPAP